MRKVFMRSENPILFTREGYEELLKEKAKLTGERPEAVRLLADARSMGDLSENGYYKASRARLSFLDARIRRVERLIRLAKIVTSTGSETVGIGNSVTVESGSATITYSIVGGYESDPRHKTISLFSPVGKALMGHRVGDSVEVQTPKGIVAYRILSIS